MRGPEFLVQMAMKQHKTTVQEYLFNRNMQHYNYVKSPQGRDTDRICLTSEKVAFSREYLTEGSSAKNTPT